MCNPQFFQNYDNFQDINWNQNKVSWCIIENDHNFERSEDRATLFLKWTDLNTNIKKIFWKNYNQTYVNFHFKLHVCILFRYIYNFRLEQNAISTVTSKFSVLSLTRNARGRHFNSNENVPKHICYSHWANGAKIGWFPLGNGVCLIMKEVPSDFPIWQLKNVTTIIFSNHKTY